MNNINYISALRTLSKITHVRRYIILGSVATLSYTQKVGYIRQIHDIDVIMDKSEANKTKRFLLENGYELKTFIDKRMPFYKLLKKRSKSHYLRFTNKDVAIEILSTKFIQEGNTLKFDLYPNIWVQIPKNLIVTQGFGGVRFTTLDLDLVWAVKEFLNNTLGKFIHYKSDQRKDDLAALRRITNVSMAKKQFSRCKLGYKKIKIKVPSFFL